MKHHTVRHILGTAFTIFGISACGPAKAPEKPSPAANAAASASDAAGPSFTPDDVHFMQGMIGHHAQAVTMTAWAATHGASPAVALLCQRINNSQTSEIAMMRTWLKDRNQTVPDSNDPHPMMMPGMLTAEQMDQLDKAHGMAFDSLFLTGMIQHHQGALDMVEELRKSPRGGQSAEMANYTTDVENSQHAEINRMEALLKTLKGSKSK